MGAVPVLIWYLAIALVQAAPGQLQDCEGFCWPPATAYSKSPIAAILVEYRAVGCADKVVQSPAPYMMQQRISILRL